MIVRSTVALAWVSPKTAADDFSGGLAQVRVANLVLLNFLQPTLPGVFDHHPAQTAVNGALWTLKIKVLFYASVPLFVTLFRRFSLLPVLLAPIWRRCFSAKRWS